jgi:hypothetical protein
MYVCIYVHTHACTQETLARYTASYSPSKKTKSSPARPALSCDYSDVQTKTHDDSQTHTSSPAIHAAISTLENRHKDAETDISSPARHALSCHYSDIQTSTHTYRHKLTSKARSVISLLRYTHKHTHTHTHTDTNSPARPAVSYHYSDSVLREA